MNKITPFISMCVAAMIAAGIAAGADTEFTYQGDLKDNGNLANGSFNMDFSLWNAGVGGNQIGSTLVQNGVQVIEGKFTVELDFGADAFDNSGRWLKIVVNGFTLSPRNPITRSPYSIQTRGIFVGDDEQVGIGTTSPQHALHVADDGTAGPVIFGHATTVSGSGAVGVTGQSEGIGGTGVYGYAASPTGLTYGVKGYSYSTNGIGVYGSAERETGISYGLYGLATSNSGTGVYSNASSLTGNTYAFRGICASPAGYAGYFSGRGYFSGNTGFGITPQYPVHAFSNNDIAIYAKSNNHTAIFAEGGVHGIDASSNTPVFPTIFAQNTAPNGSVLWAIGDSDASLAGGGLIVAGDQASTNIAIDDNEIMARFNGGAGNLRLQADGGSILMGPAQIKPPLAYGTIESNGVLISGSSNISTYRYGQGGYAVQIAGGFNDQDIILVSTIFAVYAVGGKHSAFVPGEIDIGVLMIDGLEPVDTRVSFIIYRP